MVAARRWETNRIEAFSDGVFAIAITLLVLEIKIEPEQFDHLLRALLDEWPAYLAYVTSFLTVGSVWIAHHNLYTHLRFIDPVLLRLNLLLLLAAAFLPFPTAIMAQAFDASENAERVAVAFYGGTALVIELLLGAAVTYAASRPDLTDTTPPGAAPPAAAEAPLARGGDGIALRPGHPRGDLHLPEARGRRLPAGRHPRHARDRRRGPAEPARADPALTHSAMRLRGLEPPRA